MPSTQIVHDLEGTVSRPQSPKDDLRILRKKIKEVVVTGKADS